MMLPVNNVLKDLTSRNELFVSLSLCFAGSGAPFTSLLLLLSPIINGWCCTLPSHPPDSMIRVPARSSCIQHVVELHVMPTLYMPVQPDHT